MRNESDRRHEAHKFADDALRSREDEEGYGRLRMALFWAAVGPLGCGAIKVLDLAPPRYVVHGLLATIPLSILVLIINYLRLPNRIKTTGQALSMVFMTLLAAGATFVMYSAFSLSKFTKAS
jgi:hypothetical protein